MERKMMMGLGLGLGVAISGMYMEGSHAMSNTTAEVTASVLNLRSLKDSSVIGKLAQGTKVTVIKDLSGGFVHVRTNNGMEGKCSKDYLKMGNSTNYNTGKKYTVNVSSLNVRKGAGTGYAVSGSIYKGEVVEVVSVANGWAQIKYGRSKTGYCSMQYLSVASSTSTSTNTSVSTSTSNTQGTNKVYSNVVSGFSTTYATGSNRAKNVELAAKRINNVVIKPGATFRFRSTIGPITSANGYYSAPVMSGGVISGNGVGGGVCQVSSTLYAAALKAGLTNVSARTHSGKVSYMAAGMDAVISSSSDLTITNTYKEDIVIKTSCSGGRLSVQIVSVNPLLGGKTYELKTQALSGKQYKLFLMEKKNGLSRAVYTRTSNYVR